MSVLILGATSRIAQQVGHRYAQLGHPICFAARKLEEAEAIASLEVKRAGRIEIGRKLKELVIEEPPKKKNWFLISIL